MSGFERGGLGQPGLRFEDVLSSMRIQIGESALFWCHQDGHEVSAGWWKALSGAPSLSFNVLLCYGAEREAVTRSLETVADLKLPSTIMLAGRALAFAQTLCDAGWVCLGSTPMMALSGLNSADFEVDPNVSRASPDDIEEVRSVVCQTFHMDDDAAALALPDTLMDRPGHSVWTITIEGGIRSCMISVVVESSMVCWSMATLPSAQGHGYGRRLLASVLASHATDGVTTALLYSSPAGERLYRSLGYQTMEHWQLWSRPRWALGAA